MAALLKLHVGVVLKHVLDLEPVLLDDYDSEEEEDEDEDEDEGSKNGDEPEEQEEIEINNAANNSQLSSRPLTANSDSNASDITTINRNSKSNHLSKARGNGSAKFVQNGRLSGSLVKKSKVNGRRTTERRKHHKRGRDPFGADLLDFTGPKLIHGSRTFLLFHQICGQLNWIGLPLWFSILYKTLVISFAYYTVGYRLGQKFYTMNIINENYKNPIFIFISCIAMVTLISQNIVTFRTNLFDLCPMYKILTTPKLCFIKVEVQHLLGTQSLGLILLFMVYNGLLLSLLMHKSWSDFVDKFSISTFLLEAFASTIITLNVTGTAMIDLYIRSAFGHWLLALKSHLENRFMHFHRRQRNRMRHLQHTRDSTVNGADLSGVSMATTTFDTISYSSSKSLDRPFNVIITLDEIQRNLNNMDDHLEVLRSVQVGCLVHISLNAFLVDGALFLLAYHLLANQGNFHHGFVLLLVAVNFIFVIFVCYSGDRWVYYALSSFVQTVEDEYFMQTNDMKLASSSSSNANPLDLNPSNGTLDLMALENLASMSQQQAAAHQLLLIKKKDVLFCREFLHQFENHLATPWSKLTVKAHLHMLRTFVTLIAAQIIFDHEH